MGLFGFFQSKQSIIGSGLLQGAVDCHCHILPGVDDGVSTMEESLSVLSFLEEAGLKTLWLTPHIMEDVPNKPDDLKKCFASLKGKYAGSIELKLASENMLDTLYEERLRSGDILTHGEDRVLVETSTIAPPINFHDMLDCTMKAGYRPILAHPERYRYMVMNDYERLHVQGILFQLNLPSILGVYGESVKDKAMALLERGWYSMAGSDCHRQRSITAQYNAQNIKLSTISRLESLLKNEQS